jgi:hypothetical protein
MNGLLGAFAPVILEVWVTLIDVTHHHKPARGAHPRASVALAVEGLASGGGDFLHGLADGLDYGIAYGLAYGIAYEY